MSLVPYSSVYVALVPPAGRSLALALKGGREPNQIHLTLAYLGLATDFTPERLDALRICLSRFVSTQSPLDGFVTTPGRFTAGVATKGRSVLWRAVEIEGLDEMRASLVAHLASSGFPLATTLPFVPHLTLAYTTPDAPLPDAPPPLPWSPTHLTLFAGTVQTAFPFQKPPLLSTPSELIC